MLSMSGIGPGLVSMSPPKRRRSSWVVFFIGVLCFSGWRYLCLVCRCFLLVCLCACRFILFMFILGLFISIVEGLFCVRSMCIFIMCFVLFSFILFLWARPVGRACFILVVWLF